MIVKTNDSFQRLSNNNSRRRILQNVFDQLMKGSGIAVLHGIDWCSTSHESGITRVLENILCLNTLCKDALAFCGQVCLCKSY